MYHATDALKGTLNVEGIAITTDVFHAVQVVDTFYFNGLERFPAFELKKGLNVIDVGAHHGMPSEGSVGVLRIPGVRLIRDISRVRWV